MRKLMLFITLSLVPLVLLAAEPPAPSPFPLQLVRILTLSATGPDNAEHTLYTSTDGFVTPRQELGRVGYQVQGMGLADGRYHTLFVELADRYQEIVADGTMSERRLSDSGKETRVRIDGMVLVSGGTATPLGMLESDTPRLLPRGRHDDDD